jgi:hypothetical protein
LADIRTDTFIEGVVPVALVQDLIGIERYREREAFRRWVVGPHLTFQGSMDANHTASCGGRFSICGFA